jgi:hypothetical protein
MAGTPEHLHTRCKLERLLDDLCEQMISNNVEIARDLLMGKIKSRIPISNRRNFKRSYDNFHQVNLLNESPMAV